MSAPDEIDLARAQEYALLSSLLLKAPSSELLAQLAALRGDATQLGKVHAELAGVASKSRVESVEREHFLLFSGVGRGELLPYASYYLTGFVQGRPLADLRQISLGSASSSRMNSQNRRITRESCWRSWREWRKVRGKGRQAPSVPFSTSTWSRGSRASSRTSSALSRRSSMPRSAHSAEPSLKSSVADSSCQSRTAEVANAASAGVCTQAFRTTAAPIAMRAMARQAVRKLFMGSTLHSSCPQV